MAYKILNKSVKNVVLFFTIILITTHFSIFGFCHQVELGSYDICKNTIGRNSQCNGTDFNYFNFHHQIVIINSLIV